MIRQLCCVFALLTFIAPSFAADKESEEDLEIKQKNEESKRYDDSFYMGQGTKVVLNKFYNKDWRHEIFLHGLVAPFGSVYWAYGGGLSYTFHFTDNWGWEVVHAQYMKSSFTSFGSSCDVNGTCTTGPNTGRGSGVDMHLNKPTGTIMSSVNWNGAYGKLRLFGTFIWRFDLFALAGIGMAKTLNGNEPAGSWGVGARGFLGRYFAIRIELRDFIHKNVLNPFVGVPADSAKRTTEIKNNFEITFGVSMYLPGFERYEDE